MQVYLLASFPALSPEGPCPIRFADFMRECAAHLSSSDFEELDAVCTNPPAGKSDFSKAWAEAYGKWQRQNKTERLQRLPQETEAAGKTFIESDQLRNDQQQAWQATDPLIRETALQRSLWNWIEEHRRQSPFSLQDLMGYALQLQRLERRESWNETEGAKQFQIHTQSFLEPVLEELRKQELSA